jgi:hypothetical protein
MLLALSAPAFAITWTCPGAIAVPADALPFHGDGGMAALLDAVDAEAEAHVPADCAWTTTVEGDSTIETCTGDDGTVVTRITSSTSGEDDWDPSVYTTSSYDSLDVTLPEGAADWTRIVVSADSASRAEGSSWGASSHESATWSGSPLGLTADSAASSRGSSSYEGSVGSSREDRTVTFTDCSWSWSDAGDWEWSATSVEAGGHTVDVETGLTCDAVQSDVATFDGILFGHVNADTWELEDDADQDGWTPGDDCDDADPDTYPCGEDTPYDGIDQDCDGADSHDGDGDGTDTREDCDDTNRHVHPGADDPPGDGVDGDCDGADDVDADGDGYTADGDDDPADCDDGNPSVFPGAREIPDDGVDEDCDGEEEGDALGDEDGDHYDDGDDCDDADPDIHPGAPEIACDGIDQDCDGADAPCALPRTDEPERHADEPEHDSCAVVDPTAALAPMLLALAMLRARRPSAGAG